MKIAVVSDIHSNLEAWLAVSKDMAGLGVDTVFCLGDVVGYYAHAQACLESVRARASIILKGNHEHTCCLSKLPIRELSDQALQGIIHSKKQLGNGEVVFMDQLPIQQVVKDFDLTLAHGAVDDNWKYIDSVEEAELELAKVKTRIYLVGHTHIPFVFGSRHGLYEVLVDDFILEKDERYLINVGSVGQPRDGDCRACYGLLEFIGGKTFFNLRRVFYNIAATEKAALEAGLPMRLTERLYRGQ